MKKSLKLNHKKICPINHEIKILHHKKCNLWYICVPIKYNIIPEKQRNYVSIDPGIKTFLTLYDVNGNVIKLANTDMKNKLVPLYKKIDDLKSIKSNLIKRINKLRYKLKNLIDEIHNKCCRFIYLNYTHVLIPVIGGIKYHMHKHG